MSNQWEIENFLEVKENRLHIDGVDTVDLAREHGTPLFVFSESRIRHNIARLERVRNFIDCPLKICYAAKAMSTMGILRVVKDSGIDIEVNSGGELWKALEIGFRGDQIIFNGTSKEVWEIENAINAEIYAIQVDSMYELSLIEETARRLGKRANVSLRLVPEIESGTHSGLQTALLTSKFGMMPDEAFEAFKNYKDSPDVHIDGVHLHIGSQNPTPEVYEQALEILADNLLRVHKALGVRLRHINLGGGFPVDYSRGSVFSTFPEGLEAVMVDRLPSTIADRSPRETVERFRERQNGDIFRATYSPAEAVAQAWTALQGILRSRAATHIFEGITLLLEPGRSVIADAGICLTAVRNKKKRPRPERENSEHTPPARPIPASGTGAGSSATFSIYLLDDVDQQIPLPKTDTWLLTDAGFNILLSMVTYRWYYHLISASRASNEHGYPYKVAGPLCDGGDVYFDVENKQGGRLPAYRLLPQDVRPGEVLALLTCGAYSLAQASQYNGRFLPAVLLVRRDGQVELVRKRDAFDDLVANDIY